MKENWNGDRNEIETFIRIFQCAHHATLQLAKLASDLNWVWAGVSQCGRVRLGSSGARGGEGGCRAGRGTVIGRGRAECHGSVKAGSARSVFRSKVGQVGLGMP